MVRHQLKKLFPDSLHFRLVSLKHSLTKFKQFHYAQNAEDIMVRSLFPQNYRGFYVDVGAHHPYRISNTYLLFQKGWRGINIDANPETIQLFKKARPKDTNVCVGIAQKAGALAYHQFSDPAVNTFSQAAADTFINKNWITYLGAKEILVRPLRDVLAEHLPDKQTIDVLNVDVEGFDLVALQSNDWNTYQPKVVIVEDHNFDIEQMQNCETYTYLLGLGYKLKYVMKFSLIFVHKDAKFK